ncbi:hypothetical protein EYS14_01020 [Alteromonadaceae bacterium M269]|nr:hypothetical protein EYS14_01020 [Alteromonadaceae bacterium M269]
MAGSNSIKAYSFVFGILEDRVLNDDNHFCGFISLDDEVIDNLKTLVECELCDTSVDLFKDNQFQVSIGIDELNDEHYPFNCKIALSSQWEKNGFYIGTNWDLLLKSATRIFTPVKQAFFTDTSELTKDDSIHYRNYLKLSSICKFIDEVALPASDNKARTIIYDRHINIVYTLRKEDLDHNLNTEAIERLLHKDLHHEAKVSLVREALVKFLKDKGTNQRFGYLVSNFNAFSSELLLSYQGYVEQYTFDKVRKEYQEKKTEYIQKINETYSDIGAKILAIPAGLWLAVFKLEEAPIGSFGFIKNIVILTLCILCMLYAVFNFSAQFSILKSIREEYKLLFERLAKEHDDECDNINRAKKLIDTNAEWTWWKLTLSNFATIVIFVMVFILSWFSLIEP